MAKQRGGAIVDLGNVIIAHRMGGITPENFHVIDYNAIPEVPGVFEALRWLNDKFGCNVTVVYKATDIATDKILAWLAHHRFTERTGIPLTRVVRTKGGRDKTGHLDQSSDTHYGTTVVVDDRLEVMSYFVGRVPYMFLFRPQREELEEYRSTGAHYHVCIVNTWKEIESILGAI